MVEYSTKNIFKKMCRTFLKRNLRYEGPYDLYIVKRVASRPDNDPEREFNYMLLVKTENGRYQGLIDVNIKEYRKYRAGDYYGRGGVLYYTKKENCYYMSKYSSEKKAISKAVNESRLSFAFAILVIAIAILLNLR